MGFRLSAFFLSLFGRKAAGEETDAVGPQGERRWSARESESGGDLRLEWRDGAAWRVEQAEPQDKSPGGIGLVSEFRFEPGQTIYVLREKATAVQANVRHVEPAGESYHVGLALIPRERRRTDRTHAAGEADLHWTGPRGDAVRIIAEVRNVSEGGLQIETNRLLETGSVVRLSGTQVECLASVRYCREHGVKYLVGLQIIGQPFLTSGETA